MTAVGKGESLTMDIARLSGIIPPMVTPFREDGSIDEQAHRRDVRYMIDQAKVHGLAVCQVVCRVGRFEYGVVMIV